VEEINAAGGVKGLPIRLIIYDYASIVSTGILVAKKLIRQDEVLAGNSPCYGSVVKALRPLLHQPEYRTPFICHCSAGPRLGKEGFGCRTTREAFRALRGAIRWI
jgi:ABC-type branched-subunit amino acid transport system substrate-binding protein